jgi:hypothetical protein
VTIETSFLPFLHFLWCMSQRSLHAIMKGNYRSMSCFATVSRQMAPLAVLWYPTQSGPFCTMWFRQFTQNVTKIDHKDRSHPHSTEHDTQPTAYLIGKHAVPYRTCGGTCLSHPVLRPKPGAHRMYAQDHVVIHTARM